MRISLRDAPRVGLVAAIAAAVAAPTLGSAAGQGGEGAGEVPTVDCATRIQIVPPREHPGRIRPATLRRSVVAGPVVFIGAKQWADYPDHSRPEISIPIKSPMIVDAGEPVTIALSEESIPRARLMVGRDQRPYSLKVPSVTLDPCDPDHEVAGRRVGRRTPFPGGFKLRGPSCVELTVSTASGVSLTRRIGFGMECPRD